MNSSMLAGERRWASARRGGMTVLGKVAVPKPINLPSQRLENHGLDPNVEIVPKGTVSWGSRSSSSGSNPWSSSLSPNADGGTVSPSHLSGRPSSGGSGTRPSTSGSDRTHDPVPSVWGSNSRPSSASGTLSSNQAPSASLRPRSAENRPNSSQLSRFAEPVARSPTAWSSSVTAERLGVKSSKDDGFSLTSGDFPTLGHEKDNSVKNELEDHSRPSSASGRINQSIEGTGSQADVKHGTVDTWRADGSQSAEDDIHPSMERWQGDPHQHFNANAAPQHFDAWRGPSMNGPGGVWYGGRPQGPAFGGHVPPSGFPMEPFPYYHRPQIPPPPLAGSQPVPPPGPRGPHPKNGDIYRPQRPETYPHQGMPFRPGFYPRPPGPMAFDGYYGPPMGYERDMPYMGMGAGPPVYNGYPPSNPDISNPHGRATGRGPPGKKMSEQVEIDHWDDARGPKRVPLRSHNECDQREEGGNREQNMHHNVSHPGKSHFRVSSRKNEWGAEEDTEEDIYAKRTIQTDNSFHSYENRVHSADSVKVKSIEGMGNVKGVNDNWTNKSASATSFPPVVTPLPVPIERDPLPAVNRNSSLMNKIDGLNAKFRGSDGWNDSPSAYKEGERNGSKVVDMKISASSAEVSIAGSFERTPVSRDFISGHREVIVPVVDNAIQPTAVVSRRSYHGGPSKVDHRGKGRFNSQDADGWRKKPLNTESSSADTASNSESLLNARGDGPNIVGEASESIIIEQEGKIESDSVETYESTDIQRVKMRELAKQRALQLQKEEEERIKEQKAKALAKLEELNRRTLAGEVVNQKAERTQVISDIPGQQELLSVTLPMIAELNMEEPGFNLVPSPAVATTERESNKDQTGETVKHLDIKGAGALESNASPLSKNEDSHGSSTKKGVSQVNDGGFFRHKRTGYKHRHNNLLQKSLNENAVSSAASEAPKDHPVATTDNTLKESSLVDSRLSESNVLNTSNTVVESSTQQKRKINRIHKTKPKLDEASAVPALLPVISDTNQGNEAIGNVGSNDSNYVSAVIEPDSGVQAQGACSSVSNEESQSRVPNQWKSHHSRKLPRSQQAHRFNEKLHGNDTVVWAPVRSQNKAKGLDEASQNATQESANLAKADNVGSNSLKGKRAEMERYVPKPVAKELAQQVSVPPLSSSVNSSRSNEGAGGEQCGSVSSASPQESSATVHFGSSVEINEGDGNHNKHKNDHEAWRHGGSTDSSRMKGVHTGASSTSEPIKEIHQSNELVQSKRSEMNTSNADTKISVKDQGATGRGKRHPQRGPRNPGKNPDPESSFGGETDGSSVQPAALDVNQTDRNNVSKENRSFGERASHWQPKANRPNSANNQHGNRTTASESVTTEINRIPKKDHPQLGDSGNTSQSQPEELVNVKNNMVKESVAGHRREFDRDNKPAPYKGRPYSPSQGIVGSGETTANTGDHPERNVSSGYRRTGRQNNRPVRGHDSRGDWSSGHDNRSNNTPAYRERQKQNVHYEYQPVGPVKSNRPEMAEEPADCMENTHRERGYGHMKRGGNSYKRQSGPVHVAASIRE
ncbi:hypothetical protein ACS0TY_007175 [Phlomoides rotata]